MQHNTDTTQDAIYEYVGKAIFGVHDVERTNLQAIEISLALRTREQSAKQLDCKSFIEEFLSNHKPYLIEAMAFQLASCIMRAHPSIATVNLTIRKPKALPFARAAFSTIILHRSEPCIEPALWQ